MIYNNMKINVTYLVFRKRLCFLKKLFYFKCKNFRLHLWLLNQLQMKIITLHFYPKLFLALFIGFILCTIIGTVSHELGHAAVTASQGRSFTVHYESMSPGRPLCLNELNAEYEKNKDKINQDTPSPEKDAYLKFRKSLAKKYKQEDLHMRLGGPLQTMITGTVGLMLLWLSRKKTPGATSLSFNQWLFVLLGFFWSRQPAILLQKIYFKSIGHNGHGDEENIARHLHLNEWSVITLWGITGAFVLLWITFYAIPTKQRVTFITAGLSGSILGAYIWLSLLGPVLLP